MAVRRFAIQLSGSTAHVFVPRLERRRHRGEPSGKLGCADRSSVIDCHQDVPVVPLYRAVL
jgi:hypothetical protein